MLSSKAAEFLKKTNGTADPPPEEERPLPSLFMDFAEVQSLVMPKQLIEDYNDIIEKDSCKVDLQRLHYKNEIETLNYIY